MNVYVILPAGLLVGGVSCATVQASLLAGLSIRQHQHAIEALV
jgi:hypothetical protein